MNNNKVAQCLTDILSFRLPAAENRITQIQSQVTKILKNGTGGGSSNIDEKQVRKIVEEIIRNNPSSGGGSDVDVNSMTDNEKYDYYYNLYRMKQFNKFPNYVLFDDNNKRCWTDLYDLDESQITYDVTTIIYNDLHTFNWCEHSTEGDRHPVTASLPVFDGVKKVIGVGHHLIHKTVIDYPYDWDPEYSETKELYIDPFPCINQLFPNIEVVDLSDRSSFNGAGRISLWGNTEDHGDLYNYLGETCPYLHTVLLPKDNDKPIEQLCKGKHIRYISNIDKIYSSYYDNHWMFVDYQPSQLVIGPECKRITDDSFASVDIQELVFPRDCSNIDVSLWCMYTRDDMVGRRKRFENVVLPAYLPLYEGEPNGFSLYINSKNVTIPIEFKIDYTDTWDYRDYLFYGPAWCCSEGYTCLDEIKSLDLRNHKNITFMPAFNNTLLNAEIYTPYTTKDMKMPLHVNECKYFKDERQVDYNEGPIHIYDNVEHVHWHINKYDDNYYTLYVVSDSPTTIDWKNEHRPVYLHYRKNREYDYTQHPVYLRYKEIDEHDGTNFLSDIIPVEEEENAW